MLVVLPRGSYMNVLVEPRKFKSTVRLDEYALTKLVAAQHGLDPSIQLVITRGYEPETILTRIFRQCGAVVFQLIYPGRSQEISEIFGHNGHALDGSHIDLSVRFNTRVVRLLPLSVFTPLWLLRRRRRLVREVLADVERLLTNAGFTVHRNRIEASQIHIDLPG